MNLNFLSVADGTLIVQVILPVSLNRTPEAREFCDMATREPAACGETNKGYPIRTAETAH